MLPLLPPQVPRSIAPSAGREQPQLCPCTLSLVDTSLYTLIPNRMRVLLVGDGIILHVISSRQKIIIASSERGPEPVSA